MKPKYYLLQENICEPLLVSQPICFLEIYVLPVTLFFNELCVVVIQGEKDIYLLIILPTVHMAPGTFSLNESVTRFMELVRINMEKAHANSSYMVLILHLSNKLFPLLLNPLYSLTHLQKWYFRYNENNITIL